ncbi:hypothetical protein C8F04DRAFT_1192654 [Mycena alexandri]|uniref:Uncharacterized protein n=1 Tax=Mycena alexandri TaxID=1745969 RepID=A0AAD6SCM7_9AGAR|nr:hypothetical protein C8F04DRAFT_1192654 [Mycena alexandri]
MLIHSIKLPAAISLLPTLHRITLCCADVENESNWDYLEEPSDACSDDEPPDLDEQISLEDALSDNRNFSILSVDQLPGNIIISQQQTSLAACLGLSMPVAAFPERAQHKISKPAVLAPKITKTGKTVTASAKALSKTASAKAPSGKTPSTSVSNQTPVGGCISVAGSDFDANAIEKAIEDAAPTSRPILAEETRKRQALPC